MLVLAKHIIINPLYGVMIQKQQNVNTALEITVIINLTYRQQSYNTYIYIY